jgi:putative ABC transport system permease protein
MEVKMLSKLRTRLRALLRKSEMERELDEELRYHVEQQTEQNIRLGMGPEEARDAARKSFGGMELAKERSRDARGVRFLEELWQDLRYGARMLVKNSGFTSVAILTLALGIGANTAVFSIVNPSLLRPLPYPDADRLVMVWQSNLKRKEMQGEVGSGKFLDWKHRNQTFAYLAAINTAGWFLSHGGEIEVLDGVKVTADFFQVMGVQPLLGRTFLAEEEEPGKDRVVILSHRLWRRSFGSDPNIVGRAIVFKRLRGRTPTVEKGEGEEVCTVIGVMPPNFAFPERSDIWQPQTTFDAAAANDRNSAFLQVVARLKPDVALADAQLEMERLTQSLAQEYPDSYADSGVNLTPLREHTVGQTRSAFLALMGAVSFVLLLACANVTNLLLARAGIRRKEIAIRSALGASRARILRQLLLESTLLSLLGSVAGFLLAFWAFDFLKSLVPEDTPRLGEIKIDFWVFAFTFIVSFGAGIVTGLAPAWSLLRTDFTDALKESSSSSGKGPRLSLFRRVLVAVEVALALVLLAGAGLMVKSFWLLRQVDPGFDPNLVTSVQVFAPGLRFSPEDSQRAIPVLEEMLQRVQQLPGVRSAALIDKLPFSGSENISSFNIGGRPPWTNGLAPLAQTGVVSPGYFETMGIPVLKGRPFNNQDTLSTQGAVIINESFARLHFPNEESLGQRINGREIVGVVKDVKHIGLDKEVKEQLYFPFQQRPTPMVTLVVRTATDPASLASALRNTIRETTRAPVLWAIESLREQISRSMASRRLSLALLGAFAALAFALSAVGIYGVLSYSVAQRTHEIGVRLALGAQKKDVLALILREGLTWTLVGMLLGLLLSYGLTRFIATQLYRVAALDPQTLISVALALGAVALLACYVPARRATRVDPMVALRRE